LGGPAVLPVGAADVPLITARTNAITLRRSDACGALQALWTRLMAVSYTHLTLPTICSV